MTATWKSRRKKGGIELFTYLCEDEPDLVREWITVLNEKEIRRATAIADPQIGPIMPVYTDIACTSGPLHSPRWLQAEFFPLVKKLVDAYHDRGVLCIYHSNGNLNPVMDDFVANGDRRHQSPGEAGPGMSIAATGGRGFLMGSTTELLRMVKVENLLAMVETAHAGPP